MQLKLVLEPKESEAAGKHFPYANGQWPKALRNSSTAESLNFGILHWSNVQRNWPNARPFGQTLRIWSNAARFTNWSDALRICPNAPISQILDENVKCALQH